MILIAISTALMAILSDISDQVYQASIVLHTFPGILIFNSLLYAFIASELFSYAYTKYYKMSSIVIKISSKPFLYKVYGLVKCCHANIKNG